AEHPFASHIPAGATVYWGTEFKGPWFLLHRASYYSRVQGAGLVFNRDTALEFDRRSKLLAPLDTAEWQCKFAHRRGEEGAGCRYEASQISELCRRAGGLDFLVLRGRMDRAPIARWTPVENGAPMDTTFHLYRCDAL